MSLYRLALIFASLLLPLFLFANQAFATSAQDNIVVGDRPLEVAVNPNTNTIYVTNYESGSVSVIDGLTNKVVETIAVGVFPRDIDVNPNTNMIYVAHRGPPGSLVSVIDGSTNKVIESIPIGSNVIGLTVNPNANKVYVGYWNYPDGSIFIIDGSINKVVGTITVANATEMIVVNPNTNRLYTTSAQDGSIIVIDAEKDKITDTIQIDGRRAIDIAVNPNTNKVYVLAGFSNIPPGNGVGRVTASLIIMEGSTNSIVANMNLGFDPGGIAVNPITNDVYVSYVDIPSSKLVVSAVDGTKDTIKGSLEISGGLGKIAYNPNNDSLYKVNQFGDSLTIINNATAIPEFPSLTLLTVGAVFAIIFLVKPFSKLKFKM